MVQCLGDMKFSSCVFILKFGKRHRRLSSPRRNLDCLNLEYGTDRLSRNVGNNLPNSVA